MCVSDKLVLCENKLNLENLFIKIIVRVRDILRNQFFFIIFYRANYSGIKIKQFNA